MNITALTDELDRCNKCGFCMAGCPTYQADPNEWLVTRGRVSLIQDMLSGNLDGNDPGYRQAVDSCLMCRACVSHCPPQIQIDFVITRAKAVRREQTGLAWPERLIYRGLLPRPGLLRAVLAAGGYAERLGLRRLALRSGVLRRWPTLRRAAEVGPSLPTVTGRSLIEREARQSPAVVPPPDRDRVVYFLGCTKNLLFPKAARATYRVLRANSVAVEIPRVGCCGLPALSAGDLEGARVMARKNLAILGETGGPIVVDESSCGSHLAHLGDLFAGQPEEEAIRRLSARVIDLTVYLDRLGIRPTGEVKARVAWHDPCHLRNHLGVTEAPRRLLRQIPGTTVVDANPDGQCCGGSGAYMLTQPQLSDKVLAARMETVRATGADLLITGSPSCIMQYSRAADGPKVLYLSEYLELAYKSLKQP